MMFNNNGKINEEFFVRCYKGELQLDTTMPTVVNTPFGMSAFYALRQHDRIAFYTICSHGVSGDAEDFYSAYIGGGEL